jgi:hypothetical protein
MTSNEALHIAKVVCLFNTDNEVGKDRSAIRERAKNLHPIYSHGVELATAEWILTVANPVDTSWLK